MHRSFTCWIHGVHGRIYLDILRIGPTSNHPVVRFDKQFDQTGLHNLVSTHAKELALLIMHHT